MALVNTKGEEIADAGVTGLRLLPDAKLEEIAAQLPELALIEIEFPKFRDGRGFTLGRTLRERYGYKGDLRAVGISSPISLARSSPAASLRSSRRRSMRRPSSPPRCASIPSRGSCCAAA